MFLKGKNLFLGMNYAKVLSAGFSWVSLRKLIWFLVFFWIALPVVILLPDFIEKFSLFKGVFSFFAFFSYSLMYVLLVIGFFSLTQESLSRRNVFVEKFSFRKVIDVVFLVFAEAFYVLFWNLHAPFRTLQLLLLAGSALLFYYFLLVSDSFVLNLFALCCTAYVILVVYNCVRVFFSSTIFCSKEIGIKSAIRESWALTHHKFSSVFFGIITSVVVAVFSFLFLVIIFGAFASIFLGFFFIRPVAVSIGFQAASLFALAPALVVYQFCVAEVYLQLSSHHALSSKIKGILAQHILHPKKIASKSPARKLAKKKKRK
jgi:hypothetical protein